MKLPCLASTDHWEVGSYADRAFFVLEPHCEMQYYLYVAYAVPDWA